MDAAIELNGTTTAPDLPIFARQPSAGGAGQSYDGRSSSRLLCVTDEEVTPMTTVAESVIVSGGECCRCSATTVRVHHRDYPEAMAEAKSAAEAAALVAAELVRSLEHVPDRAARPSSWPSP